MCIKEITKSNPQRVRRLVWVLLAGWLSAFTVTAATTFTVSPPNGATGVNRSTQVVFTFSDPMFDPFTTIQFVNTSVNPPDEIFPLFGWNANSTEVTFILLPLQQWPANAVIRWTLSGENEDGDPVFGTGTFSTAPGGGEPGVGGTNKVTTFAVGVQHAFEQQTAAAPAPILDYPYTYKASVTLASNRTANAIWAIGPFGVSNMLASFPISPETYLYVESTNNLTAFNGRYPGGAYQFTVQSPSSNQVVGVNLPQVSSQPGAPQIANFADCQTMDPSRNFSVRWQAFNGGTSVDRIQLTVGTEFATSLDPAQGGLTGTATEAVIPANTLTTNTPYTATLSFLRITVLTNNPTYVTIAERISTTTFPLTALGARVNPVLTNVVAIAGGQLRLEARANVGQQLILQYSDTLESNSWFTAATTNLATPSATFFQPIIPGLRGRFFRIITP